MEAPTLSVLSWNLFGAPIAPNKVERMRRAANLAAEGRYELVLFQEVWTKSQIEAIESVLNSEYASYHSGDKARPIVGLKGGLLACARRDSEWSIEAPTFHEFANEAPDCIFWQGDGLADKGVQEIRLRHDRAGVGVRVLNAHFQAPYPPAFLFDFRSVRRAQLDELLEIATSTDFPTLAFGDLNLGPNSANYQRLLESWEDLSAPERDRCQCDTHDGKHEGAAGWIDYALGRNSADWKIKAEVHRLDREDAEGMLSDHNPLSAMVRFERRQGALLPADASAFGVLAGPSTRRAWLVASIYLAARGALAAVPFGLICRHRFGIGQARLNADSPHRSHGSNPFDFSQLRIRTWQK